jgi:hypothetical protein
VSLDPSCSARDNQLRMRRSRFRGPAGSRSLARSLGLIVSLLIAIVPAVGRADEVQAYPPFPGWPPPDSLADNSPAPGWVGYRTSVALNLGLGSAVGGLGVTAGIWPLPLLGTEVGIGMGFTGTQYSLVGVPSARAIPTHDRSMSAVRHPDPAFTFSASRLRCSSRSLLLPPVERQPDAEKREHRAHASLKQRPEARPP